MSLSPRQMIGSPIFLHSLDGDTAALNLEKLTFMKDDVAVYNEAWLQRLLFTHPEILPIDEIEPIFKPLIPICRELPTKAGPVDNVFINSEGLITLVECKLWRNPDARRDVVGQILDYAKEISAWNYEDLQEAVGKTTGSTGNVLYEIVTKNAGDVDETTFVDSVTRHLKRGSFLLLIVGDGIREGIENIANFLQRHAGLHFTFGLVELGIFKMPASLAPGYLIEPRVLARTVEIERAVIRVENLSVSVEEPAGQVITHRQAGSRKSITEAEFFEELEQANPEIAELLPSFLKQGEEMGLTVTKRKSMILHWQDLNGITHNFGTIFPSGTIRTNYFCHSANEAGNIAIGEQYLAGIARLLGQATVRKKGNPWTWTVVQNGKDPSVLNLLRQPEKWLALIEETMRALDELAEA